MVEPPSDMPGVRYIKRNKKALELSRPPISESSKVRPYQNETSLVNASSKRIELRCAHRRFQV